MGIPSHVYNLGMLWPGATEALRLLAGMVLSSEPDLAQGREVVCRRLAAYRQISHTSVQKTHLLLSK